ncbi:HD domain-containing protein [Streptomyces sp. NPDC051207]|uniref:HD domain-containing protein n=1 Tax=Streptomyces sp. NPDC051207 TaxID=3154641 RepID=UPI003439C008
MDTVHPDSGARNELLDVTGISPDLPSRLVRQLEFIAEIDRLKTVLRLSPLLAADRRENDAEHSWHLAMMVLVLAEYAAEPIDIERTLKLVLVHDLVEIYAGDTCLFDDAAKADQHEREAAAASKLFALLPADQNAHFLALWEEFEARTTAEARFAKAMDRLQPLLLNAGNAGGTWRTPGVTEERVRQRTSVIADGSPRLWDLTQKLFALGVREGWLRNSP